MHLRGVFHPWTGKVNADRVGAVTNDGQGDRGRGATGMDTRTIIRLLEEVEADLDSDIEAARAELEQLQDLAVAV